MMSQSTQPTVVALPVRPGVRLIALRRLAEALAVRERLVVSRDGEALHDFRVALRRLRSGLRAYRPWFDDTVTKADRRALRDLSRSTSDARDIEVQLDWLESAELRDGAAAGALHLRNVLEKAKRRADRAALRAAHRFPALADVLRQRFARYTGVVDLETPFAPPTMGAVTARLAREHLSDLGSQLDALRHDDDPAVGHRARIEGKRLRYLIEPFVSDAASGVAAVEILKRLQDDLGEVHDLDVLEAAAEREAGRLDPDSDAHANVQSLREHLQHVRAAALTRLRCEHLEKDGADLAARVERFASELDAAVGTGEWEIERKYLLRGLPLRRKGRSVVRIDQGWLPGERILERVRRVRADGSATYLRTIKLGRGLVRREVEEEIDEAMFRKLWPLTRGRRISKRRYSFQAGERVWTVDRFLGLDLILAEIELDSPDDDVVIPDWLERYVEREVTGLADFQNVRLAERVAAQARP